MELRGTKIHETAELKMISIIEKWIWVTHRKGLVSKGELQETDLKRKKGLAIKAHEKGLNIASDAVGQKGHMRFSEYIQEKGIRPF